MNRDNKHYETSCHEKYTTKRRKKGPKGLTERTINTAEVRREEKQQGDRSEVRILNFEFQREAIKDKEILIEEKNRDLE
jgi:hypothetical protein